MVRDFWLTGRLRIAYVERTQEDSQAKMFRIKERDHILLKRQ